MTHVLVLNAGTCSGCGLPFAECECDGPTVNRHAEAPVGNAVKLTPMGLPSEYLTKNGERAEHPCAEAEMIRNAYYRKIRNGGLTPMGLPSEYLLLNGERADSPEPVKNAGVTGLTYMPLPGER